MGDGGAWRSPRGESGERSADEAKEVGEGISFRLARDTADLPLLDDLTEAASDFSAVGSPLASMAELLGLSVLLDPGILERNDRKDRDESLVSERLKDG